MSTTMSRRICSTMSSIDPVRALLGIEVEVLDDPLEPRAAEDLLVIDCSRSSIRVVTVELT